jgi:hypothetical protein
MENKYHGMNFKVVNITDRDGVAKTSDIHGETLDREVMVWALVEGRSGMLHYLDDDSVYLRTSTVESISEAVNVFTNELMTLHVVTRNTIYTLEKI